MAGLKRRRWIPLALVGLVALGGWGGWVLSRASTTAEFVAGALGTVIGRRVELTAVSVRAASRLEIDLRDLRVLRGDGTPLLEAERVVARVDWPRLLAGQFVPDSWTLERPVLRLETEGEAGGTPWPVRLADLTVTEGTLLWGSSENGGLRLTRVEASARAPSFPGGLRGTALGQVEKGGRSAGSFSVEFDARSDGLGLRGMVSGWDLGALLTGGDLEVEGEAAGEVSLRLKPAGPEIEADVDVRGLSISHPSLRKTIEPEQASVRLRLVREPQGNRFELRPLRMDDLTVRGTIRVGSVPEGRVVADLSVDPFQAGREPGRLQFLRLMGSRFATWEGADQRSEDGMIEIVRAHLDVPRSQMADALAFRRINTPGEVRLEARIRGGVYRPNPEGAPLEDIEAEIRIRGNRIEVYDLRMTRDGSPLPEIDVTVEGLHRLFRLPVEERGTPRGPGVPIPGLGPGFRALADSERPDDERAKVRVRDLRLGYPAFVLPIRDASGTLTFPDGNVQVEDLAGVIGGAPATANALWDRAQQRVIVDLAYADGEAAPGRPPEEAWIEGRFEVDSLYVGAWRLRDVGGSLRGVASEIELLDVRGWMAEGALESDGTVDLSREDEAPVELSLSVTEASAASCAETLELSEGTLKGTLNARGSLSGPLRPDEPFLAVGRIELEARVEEGVLGNLPITVTLARLASPLGWTGLFGRPLPFETLDVRLHVGQGVLHVSDFQLTGPQLRILSAGQVDVVSEDRPVDLLVALLLLQSVDRVIDTVPVIGDWVLGKDGSLMALYFRLEGPWAEPRGQYLPPQTLRTATGWAERLIAGGVRRLGRILRPGTGAGSP